MVEIFIKPSGAEVMVNSNSREAALSLGWIPKDQIPVVVDQVDNVVPIPK